MKKLSLRLDDLRVDSFATEPARREKGTVFGEQCTCPTACSCPGCPTCDASCQGTCDATCQNTCAASCYGSCDVSCGDTCDFCNHTQGNDTCDPTCAGWATYAWRHADCQLCW